MRTFTLELALAGLLVISSGCNKDGDTSETGQETGDTTVPTTETDCNDGDDNDQDGDEDCADSDCVSEAECMFVPEVFTGGGAFAYDATADEVTSAILADTVIPPIVQITLGNADWADTNADEDACVITLTYNGTAGIPLDIYDSVETQGTFSNTADDVDIKCAGFKMPANEYDIETTAPCDALDTTVLGTVDEIAAQGWGIGICPGGGLLEAGLASVPVDEQPFYYGGGLLIGTEFSAIGYGTGIEIDADGNALNGAGTIADATDASANDFALIAATDAVPSNNIPVSGWYNVGFLAIFGVQ